MKNVKFDIQGMTCSSCASHVDKAVNKLDGVKNVNVNLLSNCMALEYDEKKINPELIIKAVEKAGYGATLEKHGGKKEDSISNTTDDSHMKKRLIISFMFLILLMFTSMHHMIFQLLHISTPEWIANTLDGNENAISYAFTQLLFLVPIIYCNRNYFKTGLKRLFKFSPNMDSLIALRKWNWNVIWYICNIQNWLWHGIWRMGCSRTLS